ncbi:CRISPR-associated helicase Cas3' [Microbacterium sp.]|uniref:CRISPR-associated helicase Cas3' n=1 Tax=Microbacterium sp. TaxID=51671 RepID=UPI0028125B9B|nr:CRISPR-associated helicase Cas3' [Microbacterium sp.]
MATDIDVEPPRGLSPAALWAWAKSDADPVTGEIIGWLPVHQHLADTAAVAGLLWDRWLSPAVRHIISADLGSEPAARSLAVWLAGQHDVGKISPAFAIQVRQLTHPMRDAGLSFSGTIEGTPERQVARHEIVSHLAVSQWLEMRHGFERMQAAKLGSVLAAHHGRPPGPLAIHLTASDTRLHGTGLWAETRFEMIESITSELGSHIEAWRTASLSQPVLVLLSAIVIVADWIASSERFPLVDLREQPRESAEQRAVRAWDDLDLPAPWTARPPEDDTVLFRDRFGIDGDPRPVQREMMRLAREVPSPTLMILEADTGIGKTEAALAAAEILAARFERSGVFLGLPTQATADGMFARLLRWAEHLDLEAPVNVFLAHGKSALNEQNARKRQDARFRAIGDPGRRSSDDELVRAHEWLADAKRGPLSSLVVGTIDQALSGALRTRHVALRHLALAGKVVVLDEVHAYDAYMSQYLERILHWLGSYEVPVIMLSATLPAERRKAFVAAYESGRPKAQAGARLGRAERRAAREEGRAPLASDPLPSLTGDIGYPSIVISRPGNAPEIVMPGATGRARSSRIERITDDDATLCSLLAEALHEGGCAVVIRNTVARAQHTASSLRHVFGPDNVTVAHSRFLGLDRAARDRWLLARFGPNGDRPQMHIVVATQVVEQSLDLDFDLLVTDIAPIDLLIQRAGRLHRHARSGRPERVKTPRLVIAGTQWNESPPETYRGNTMVYDRAVLLRTFAVLDGRAQITLPDDTPSLVQAVYSDTPLGLWDEVIESARIRSAEAAARSRAKATTFLLDEVFREPRANLINWIRYDAGDPDRDPLAQGAVRDTDETLEVLVLQQATDGRLQTPSWLGDGKGGIPIPTEVRPDHRLTTVMLGCSLRLPAAVCRGALIDRHIRTLEDRYPAPAWHGSHALRGELVLVLDAGGGAVLDPFDLQYTAEDGLSFSPRKTMPESEIPV